MTTLTCTGSNTAKEVVDDHSSTSCVLLDSSKDYGMVPLISRDDDNDGLKTVLLFQKS